MSQIQRKDSKAMRTKKSHCVNILPFNSGGIKAGTNTFENLPLLNFNIRCASLLQGNMGMPHISSYSVTQASISSVHISHPVSSSSRELLRSGGPPLFIRLERIWLGQLAKTPSVGSTSWILVFMGPAFVRSSAWALATFQCTVMRIAVLVSLL